MPTGVYRRTKKICLAIRRSHKKGYISSYKKPKPIETKTGIPTVLSKAMRGWTKWGGTNYSFNFITPEWYCQCCKEKQTDGLPSYLIRMIDVEYARICSKCFHEAIIHSIDNVFDLIENNRYVDNI